MIDFHIVQLAYHDPVRSGNGDKHLPVQIKQENIAMTTLAERLFIAREDAGLTQTKLAKLSGCSQSLIGNLEAGSQQSSAKLPRIAQVLGVESLWLAEGRGNKDPKQQRVEAVATASPHSDDYAEIRQFSVNGSCGDGYMNEHVEIRGSLAFKRDWLARAKIDPDNCAVIYAKGDSMYPTLTDGEVLLVDYAQKDPLSSRVFVINIDGDLRVKRLFKRISGWVISSDNSDKTRYPDEEINTPLDLRIIGRVVWRGGGI